MTIFFNKKIVAVTDVNIIMPSREYCLTQSPQWRIFAHTQWKVMQNDFICWTRHQFKAPRSSASSCVPQNCYYLALFARFEAPLAHITILWNPNKTAYLTHPHAVLFTSFAYHITTISLYITKSTKDASFLEFKARICSSYQYSVNIQFGEL